VTRKLLPLVCLALAVAMTARAQAPRAPTQTDEYTRYELLAPETAQFRIFYEVTAITPGALYYFNPIRKGSEASDESVLDRMTGKPLKFEEVSGAEARAAGMDRADLDTRYIKVTLPRAVPKDGQVRLQIDKTYKDAKSYFTDGELIVFSRPLGIKRNSVVLPAGLRARLVQRAVAGHRAEGRAPRDQLHERRPRPGLAGREGEKLK
jgi:hypothetical protein